MSVLRTTEMWGDQVRYLQLRSGNSLWQRHRCTVMKVVGVGAALTLLAGCTSGAQGTDSLQADVEDILDQAGQQVLTRLVITPEAESVKVGLRTDGTEVWWTHDGAGEQVDQPSITGASRADAIDFEALADQLSSLQTSCSTNAQVEAFVSVTGDVIADSVCDGTIAASSINGSEPQPVDLDLTDGEDLDRAMAEVAAILPNGIVYQLSLPGPASPRGQTLRADGNPWVLADGTSCLPGYIRAMQPAAGDDLRSYVCDGHGQQTVDGQTQEAFDPTEIRGADLAAAIQQALDESGYDPQTVSYYAIEEMLTTGLVLLAVGPEDYYQVTL